MSDLFQTDQYVIHKAPDSVQGGGGGGGSDLDNYADSTNAIADADKIVTREDADDTWYKKTFSKVWDYISGKIQADSDILSKLHPVGTIIESTTCDTMAKVVAAYGGTTWKQHTGYILRGATSNVTSDDNSNSGNGFGGSDTETLTGAQSGLKKHGHGFTQPTVNNGAVYTGDMTQNNPHLHSQGQSSSSSGGTQVVGVAASGSGANYNNGTTNYAYIGHTHLTPNHTHTVSGGAVTDASASNATSAHSTVQRYKNVYIWERTA